MINIDEKSLSIITGLVKAYFPYCHLWIIGSRINGTSRKFSDVDIVLSGDSVLPLSGLFALKEALRESNLVISVDVLDYRTLSDDFRKIVDENHLVVF